MKQEQFVDKILMKIEKQSILHLWEDGQGCTAEEIASELNIPNVKWVKEFLKDYEYNKHLKFAL